MSHQLSAQNWTFTPLPSFIWASIRSLDHTEQHLSTSVDVTFLENVFPFRRFPETSPASLLWGADAVTTEGDARLGMFENTDPASQFKPLDRQTLKAIRNLETKDAPPLPPALPGEPD